MPDAGEQRLPDRHGREPHGDDDEQGTPERLAGQVTERTRLVAVVARPPERYLRGEPGDSEVQQPVPDEADPGQRLEGTAARGAARGTAGGLRDGHARMSPAPGS